MKVWQRARPLVQLGALKKPLWFDIVEKIPPLPYPGRLRDVRAIQYPEDRLRKAFYDKFPNMDASPIYSTVHRSTCDRFVDHAVSLVAKGMSEPEAVHEATNAFAAEIATAVSGGKREKESNREVMRGLLAELRAKSQNKNQPPPGSPKDTQ